MIIKLPDNKHKVNNASPPPEEEVMSHIEAAWILTRMGYTITTDGGGHTKPVLLLKVQKKGKMVSMLRSRTALIQFCKFLLEVEREKERKAFCVI